MEKIKVTCEIEVTLKMISGIYKPLILYYLTTDGTNGSLDIGIAMMLPATPVEAIILIFHSL